MRRGANLLAVSSTVRNAVSKIALKPVTTVACDYLAPTGKLVYSTGSLIVLAGPSGVGKSTWGKSHFEEKDILSSDRMRELISGSENNQEVSSQAFLLLHKVASQRLAAQRAVIVDSTALSVEARNGLVVLAQEQRAKVHLILLEGTRDLCSEGQHYRDRKVPEEVIDDQLVALKDLQERIKAKRMGTEGISSVISLNRQESFILKEVTFE